MSRPDLSKVRSKNTIPELAVRKVLTGAGFRYRLHSTSLSGTPDIVFPGRRKVIFVHGCFWHQHAGCKRAGMPLTNRDYWTNKLARNKTRDLNNVMSLHEAGWGVLVLWECETKQLAKLELLLVDFLSSAAHARLELWDRELKRAPR